MKQNDLIDPSLSNSESSEENLNFRTYKKWDKHKLAAHYLNFEFSENLKGFLDENNQTRIFSELSYPIHSPFKQNGIDFIAKLPKKQYNWKNLISANEVDSVKERIFDNDPKYITLTKNLFNCYNNKAINLPYVSDYNPYFTKGLLDYLELNGCNYLIRSDCDNNLCLINTEMPHSETFKWNLNKFEITKPIFGLAVNYFNEIRLLTLLHENQVNLLSVQSTNEVEKQWSKTFKSMLLDVKLNDFNQSQLGVIGRNLDFVVYNIENNNTKLINSSSDSKKSARKLDFLDTNRIALMNENSLKFLDYRSSDDCNVFQPKLDECNTFNTFRVVNDNVVYIVARHYLIRTDIRSLKNYEFCSHLMKFSPCYMDLTQNYLCLSNQKDERVLFTGNPINTLPQSLPSVQNTLYELKLVKDILLKDKLDERFKCSTAGIKLLNELDGVALYSTNSFGEIFKQRLSEEEGEINNEKSLSVLYDWIRQLPQPIPKLYLTNVMEMGSARFILNKRAIELNLRKYEVTEKCDKFLKNYTKRIKKKYLGEVGAGFAAVWDDDEESDSGKDDEMDKVPEVPAFEKVHSWIQSSSFLDKN